MKFRVVAWVEDQFDASFDRMEEREVSADTADEAVVKFKEDFGDSVVVQCVVEVK